MSKTIVMFYPKLEPQKEHHYMPYSALCVASKYLADGHDVKIVDDRVSRNSRIELLLALEFADELIFSVYTGYQVTRAYEMAKFVKKHMSHMRVVFAGPHVTALPRQTAESEYVDDIITGYAEYGEHDMPWNLVDINDYINPETRS